MSQDEPSQGERIPDELALLHHKPILREIRGCNDRGI